MAAGRLFKYKLRRWVNIVHKEFGLEDKTEYTMNWFEQIRRKCYFEDEDWYYICAIPYPNLWGEIELSVLSYYIVPEKRTVKNFWFVQNRIKDIAKSFNARYIIQRSHLNGKLNGVLMKKGYKQGSVIMEL